MTLKRLRPLLRLRPVAPPSQRLLIRSVATTTSISTEPPVRTTPPPCRTPSLSAKLPALHSRLSLHPAYPIETLARALVHSSADADHRFNNHTLATLGDSLLQYLVSEHILTKFPRLPTAIHQAAIDAYAGHEALDHLGRNTWGIEVAYAPVAEVDAGLLQLKRLPPGEAPGLTPDSGVTVEYAMASAVRAIIGGIYLHEGGLPAVRQFTRLHILSRKLDVEKMFLIKKPTLELSRLCAREGFESPVARLHAETGRLSSHAVFVVGVYSGKNLLGEGHGGSLQEARTRAAVNALKAWYLYSPLEKDLPSKTLEDPKVEFKPAFIDAGEVII
ncbi:ribonuclease III [Ascodesmis nigricans]|uniref:Large ribosomal subunit protein mL44 n=1 Tax=Ascodesmis nigricans TaxID=341454 RepID=A0A4S2N280_9PEZI|nr:ribonuclease III [Ascodesmis nigricans]